MGRHGLPRTDPARKPAESTSEGAEGQRGQGRRGTASRRCRSTTRTGETALAQAGATVVRIEITPPNPAAHSVPYQMAMAVTPCDAHAHTMQVALLDRWLGWQLRLSRGRGRLLGLLVAILSLGGVYLLVAATGGTPNPLVHLAYFGVIAASISYGWYGGALAGTIAGLLLGPLMPDSTASSATILGTWGWLIRLAVYAIAGVLIGGFVHWARRLGAIEVRRNRMRVLVDRAQTITSASEACHALLLDLTREWDLVGAAMFGVADGEAYLLAATSPEHAQLNRPERITGDAYRVLRTDAAGPPRRRPFKARILRPRTGDELQRHGVQSELVVGLRSAYDETVGVLYAAEHGEREGLEVDEHHALAILSRGAGALVRRSQTEESTVLQRLRTQTKAALADPSRLQPVFQPIASLGDGHIVGYEALARFPERDAPPNVWFAEAEQVGLGAELQALALRRAREEIARDPPASNQFVALNISPSYLAHPAVLAALEGDLGSIVLELSEAEQVTDYQALRELIEPYRRRGARIAIDDTGAGYASLRHVTELQPDLVKLDARLITGLGTDLARIALVRSIQTFTREIRATLVAEGVESADDVELLRTMAPGLLVQGFAVSRPAPAWPTLHPAAKRLLCGGRRPQRGPEGVRSAPVLARH